MTYRLFDFLPSGNGYKVRLVLKQLNIPYELIPVDIMKGASRTPENVKRILEAIPGLGLLFDTGNWQEDKREAGWALGAHHARATHLKTFAFDDEGNETTVDIPRAMRMLQDAVSSDDPSLPV